MYFEFLLRCAHSRSRVDVMYWSGCSLSSRVTCSNSVTIGVTMTAFPQFGLLFSFSAFNYGAVSAHSSSLLS